MLCAFRSQGPWRSASFDSIAEDRNPPSTPIHRPEDFSGLLHEESGEPSIYPQSTSLDRQAHLSETFADGRNRYRESGISPSTPRRVMSLTEAGVITPDGIVYCRRTRRAVAETLRQWLQPPGAHTLLGASGYPPARRLQGLSLSLLTLSGSGFYHFLLESIPRLQLLRPWLKKADHVLCVGGHGSFQHRWLIHAGLDEEKIVWMENLCHVECEQLLFTNSLMRDQCPSSWTLASIRSAFPSHEASPGPPLRIWISRQDALIRRLEWEDDLMELLPGIKSVALARLSPREQIELLNRAEVIVSPHGAGLANIVFARPGARVIEIHPEARPQQPIYARLAALGQLDYAWLRVNYNRPENLPHLAKLINDFTHDTS